jgi:predicted ATPase/DNA-binding CsgD family transcriptional regulator
MEDERQQGYEPLTGRELEILRLIAGGLTNQQIADQLYLTLDTVKSYNKLTYQKLGVHSRIQAVARVQELGLLGGPSPAAKHNLPAQNSVFIGREQELDEIQRRLADPACRLLTLLGPGGIGKTRLAIEAAREQLRAYPDGVFFVPFASVESPEFAVQALADALGLVQTHQRDPLDHVIGYLRDRTLLLVIDNFEHLLEGVDLLGEVLARSKAAKLLVTSRERLRLKEEWVFDVQGLNYPVVRSGEPKRVDLADYEAGQLFLQTARRARSGFEPDTEDQTYIARICQLVGGMPLGIELAASWVRLLPCAEIAREVAHNLDILATAWRDVPERHRSIQAVLEHSWKLLTADEQDVFRRLTIFNGGFGREAATAVADTSLTMLLALVDKSFVRRIGDDRFDIHELVKQYGSSKLQADSETVTATRLRHCCCHAALLYERMTALDARPHLGEIERVFDDIQTSWRYAVEKRHLDEIQQLTAGFLLYYQLHSWYRAGSGALAWYQRALACFDPDTENPEHRTTIASLLESLGHLYELASAHQEALDTYEKALNNTAGDDYVRRGRLYGKVADVWVAMNRHEQGHELYQLAESALENAPRRDAAWWAEWFRIETQRMELYYWQSRVDDMAELARQLKPLIEQYGSVTQRMRYLNLLGLMALRRDHYFDSRDAITYTGEALALSLQTGDLGEIAYRHFNHGFSHLWSDHLDEAEEHLQIAREMTEQSGDLTLLARALTYLTVVYRKRGDVERVREFANDSLRVAAEAHMPRYIGMAHAEYAWIAWCEGDSAETMRQAQAAIEDWGGLGTYPFRWLVLFPLLAVALQQEDTAKAISWGQYLILAPQQRLPDELTQRLEEAVTAWEHNQSDMTKDLLWQSLRLAQKIRYL